MKSRREFVKTAGSTIVAGSLGLNVLSKSDLSWYNNSDTLKVGLIGCGGRGTGAALQATKADPNVILTAMADVFQDRLEESLDNLKNENPDKIKVAKENQFIGFDAYKKVLESDVDVVILTTPPCFRPGHLEEAIAAGKHIFCEKPVAVDSPGIKRVLKVAKEAKAKNLALMSGFCWRFHSPKRETYSRLLDGAIGDILDVYNTYNTGALWFKDRSYEWSDQEFWMRNWLYQNWLSGDHIVEQAVHSLDLMSWALGDVLPVSATGTGGRQSRTEDQFGNIYDHFAIVYEYSNGVRGYHFSRQQKGCSRSYAVRMNGTKGQCIIDVSNRHEIIGRKNWKYEGADNDMYQTEHDELFASIRQGNPFNDGIRMANSTMLAIMGRMVAYTGQTLSWDDALNSEEKLSPEVEEFKWDMKLPDIPVAKPGITKFA